MNDQSRIAALYEAGKEHIRLDENEQGLALLLEVVRESPPSALLQCDIGRALLKLKRYDEAKEHFTNARKIDSGELGALIGLGNCAAYQHDHEKAIVCYDMVILEAPAFWGSYYFKANSLVQLNCFAEALKALEKCKSIGAPPALLPQVSMLEDVAKRGLEGIVGT